MENSPANQLPEVDSLPDGFVESSAEPLTPRTPPTLEKRESEPEEDYKDPSSLSDSLAEDDVRITGSQVEMVVVEKQRTFPVTLSERDGGSDAYGDSMGETRKIGDVGEDGVECGGSMGSEAEAEVEASVVVASQNEVTMGSSHEHQHAEATVGCSEIKADDLKQSSAQGNAESHNNRKLETSDVKRKSVKRGFKTEREFLEFTLKYQQVIAERDAAITIRDKLESLCRELQRQNKMLMEECKRVSSEGQNMRLELSTKFHDAIKDVGIKLDEQKDEYLSQLKENEMLRNKLKHLSDQYAVSEQQFTQKLKQKSLKLQIADLKLQQHEEKLTHEQSQMKLYAEQVSQLLATEKNLRLQLAADGEKFQQFQDALLKSNEVFETFKQEIEKMAKSIKELKKENVFLKGKCERTDITLIELVGEREHMKKQLEKMKNQKEKLESLCRSLQAERKQNSVGSSNNEPVPLSSKIGTADEPKVDAAESNIGTTEEES